MPLDPLQPDGKKDSEPHMTGSGSDFALPNGKSVEVLVPGDAWDAYFRLKDLVGSMVGTPSLEALSNQEIRNFKGFVIVLDMAGAMSTQTMRQHVLAYWRANAEGLMKLPIGKEAKALIKIIDGGLGVR